MQRLCLFNVQNAVGDLALVLWTVVLGIQSKLLREYGRIVLLGEILLGQLDWRVSYNL